MVVGATGELVTTATAGATVTPFAVTPAQAGFVPQRRRLTVAVTRSGLVAAVTRPNGSCAYTVTRPFASVTRFGTPKRRSYSTVVACPAASVTVPG